jgi:hypothetical protein
MELAEKSIKKRINGEQDNQLKGENSAKESVRATNRAIKAEEIHQRSVALRQPRLIQDQMSFYQPFDPEREVWNTRKLKHGSKLRMNLPKQYDLRQRKMNRFRKNLVEQKKGIAEIQIRLTERIRENPDEGFGRLRSIIVDSVARFRLTPLQIERLEEGVREYMHKHAAVKYYRKKYADNEELFRNCFNKDSQGSFEVVEGPMTLYFRCHDLRDYALIRLADFSVKREITDKHLKFADKSGGVSIQDCAIPQLAGCVIAEKSLGKAVNAETLKHEEQHAIKKLFERQQPKENILEKVENVETDKRESLLKTQLRIKRKDFERRVESEFLAYFGGGVHPSDAADKLLDKSEFGSYKYFEEWKEKEGIELVSSLEKLGMDPQVIADIFRQVFVREYEDIIRKARWAMEDLEGEWHMSEEEIVNILSNEPLRKWPKLVSRLEALDQSFEEINRKKLLRYFKSGMTMKDIEKKMQAETTEQRKFSRFQSRAFEALSFLLKDKFTRGEICRLLEKSPVSDWTSMAQKAIDRKTPELYDY